MTAPLPPIDDIESMDGEETKLSMQEINDFISERIKNDPGVMLANAWMTFCLMHVPNDSAIQSRIYEFAQASLRIYLKNLFGDAVVFDIVTPSDINTKRTLN